LPGKDKETNGRQRVFRDPQAYAPTEAAINKSWKPRDVDKVK
jgi:hypothetical protein